jgi:hypothetical protein
MDYFTIERENRIQAFVGKGAPRAHAEDFAEGSGLRAMHLMSEALIKATSPVERVYKIKRSLKGGRVAVPGWEGRKFSFGPIWCELVKKGKGPALTDQAKVRAHATWVGIPNAKTRKFSEVLAALQTAL